jgi:hypothetical protein
MKIYPEKIVANSVFPLSALEATIEDVISFTIVFFHVVTKNNKYF